MISIDNIGEFPSLSGAGLAFRRPTRGPEIELTRAYIEFLPDPPVGQRVEVFVEPRLPAGFPDLVAVYWDEEAAAGVRVTDLKVNEVRLLHHLSQVGCAKKKDVEALFGAALRGALATLIGADLVHATSGDYEAAPLNQTFAVRRLVSIEAKVRDWRRGLEQAVRNTWFASESYLLVDCVSEGSPVGPAAAREGIGLVTARRPLARPIVSAQPDELPKSYAAWLFNQWVCGLQQAERVA